MRKHLLLVIPACTLLTLFSFRFITNNNNITSNNNPGWEERASIACAPPPHSDILPDAGGRYAPVFPGWGSYHYPVSTSNDSAQFFFDQGLNMYYSYHLTEALASFREAARHDSACTMAYWGQALAMGPYYNTYFYQMPPGVLPVLKQMNDAMANGTQKEKELANAMSARYPTDVSDDKRKELNRAYAMALAALIPKYPADADIKALYIDAVMLEHVWDFWETDGTPKPWTPQLVTYCDEILKAHPGHPAALHYQIHLVEASLHPEKALHSADVLKEALPGVPHMVHMSSHMYQRNGLYSKGVVVNKAASSLARQYDTLASNLKLGVFALTHYDAVGTYCAMNANMYEKGKEMSGHLHHILTTNYPKHLSSTFFQYLSMMPMFNAIRSGKWEEIIAMPEPDTGLHYARLLSHFGKGLASVRQSDTAAAREKLQQLQALMKDSSLQIRNMPFNSAIQSATIAEAILTGELLFAQGQSDAAIRSLESAVAGEDKLIYREPKEWPIPARHFLGARLLQLRKAAAAEQVYRQDLIHNPGNGWALLGLHQSLLMQRKSKQAGKYRTAFNHAFAMADELPPASVY